MASFSYYYIQSIQCPSFTGQAIRCMLPATLFWFRIRKWAQSLVLCLDKIVYFFFRLYISYFSSSPGGLGTCYHPFSDFGFENGLNCLYFVCTQLYTSSFVRTPLTFLPLLGGRGRGEGLGYVIPLFWFWIWKWTQSFVFRLYMIVYSFFRLYTSYFSTSLGGERHATLFDFGFQNGLNHLYFVCTWLYTASLFYTPLTFLRLPGGGACYPPFLILHSKMGSIVCTSFVHDCIQLFLFVHLSLFYLSQGAGDWRHATLFWFLIRKRVQLFVFC